MHQVYEYIMLKNYSGKKLREINTKYQENRITISTSRKVSEISQSLKRILSLYQRQNFEMETIVQKYVKFEKWLTFRNIYIIKSAIMLSYVYIDMLKSTLYRKRSRVRFARKGQGCYQIYNNGINVLKLHIKLICIIFKQKCFRVNTVIRNRIFLSKPLFFS